MRLVDDDGETAVAVLGADVIENERKFLDRRDNDFLAAFDEFAQVAGVLCMADGGTHLGKMLDRVLYLLVEDAPVGHNDDGIEGQRLVLGEPDERVRQPGDRVGLTAACRM